MCETAAVTAAMAAAVAGCGGNSHHASTPTTATGSATTPSTAPSTSATTATPGTTAATTSTPATTTPATTAAGGRCATSQLRVTLGQGSGAAGSVYVPLVLTNASSSICTVFGYPGVSYVAGSAGAQVGAAATRSGGSGAVITLSPGASASSTLQEVEGGNFPANECQPTPVVGLRVYPPGQTAAAFVALPSPTTGCAGTLTNGQYLLSVGPLVAGTAGMPG